MGRNSCQFTISSFSVTSDCQTLELLKTRFRNKVILQQARNAKFQAEITVNKRTRLSMIDVPNHIFLVNPLELFQSIALKRARTHPAFLHLIAKSLHNERRKNYLHSR